MKKRSMRPQILTWIILPAISVIFSINYLVGLINKPQWEKSTSQGALDVLSQDNVIPPPPVIEAAEIKSGAVTFWFDDAWSSQYTYAYQSLQAQGFKAALAVPTHLVGLPAYMNWQQVRSLQNNGWEITSHTRSHKCLAGKLSDEYIQTELLGAKQDLISLGLRADNFVSPCGEEDAAILKNAKEYYFSMRISTGGINTLPLTDKYQIKAFSLNKDLTMSDVNKWIAEAKRTKGWLIMTFHQIEEKPEDKYAISPKFFDEIVETIQKSNLEVVLPSQVILSK